MPERLLLVEDRDNLRKLLVRSLSARFNVEDVEDGSAALSRLRTGRYAVVITDVRLPGADGNAILASARAMSLPMVKSVSGKPSADASARRRASATSYTSVASGPLGRGRPWISK